MKISEFKKQIAKQKLDELSLSSFIGDVGSAAVKSGFTGKGFKQQMIQDMFLKDFYDDAYTSLDNAVKGRLVNPKARGTLSPTAVEKNPADVKPEQGQPGAKPAPAAPITPGTPAAAAPKPTSVSGRFTQPGAAPGAAPLKPTSTNVKFNMPNAPQNTNNQQYKWAPKGMKIDPNTKLSSLGATGNLAESTYHSLNRVFEHIMEVTTGGPGFGAKPAGTTATVGKAGSTPVPQNINTPPNATLKTPTVPQANVKKQQSQSSGGPQTVGQYMLSWFNQYMNGVNWKASEATVLPMIQSIEDSYPSGYKNAIKTLAKAAFAISKASPSTLPAGIKDETDKLSKNDGEETPAPSGDFGATAFKKPEANAAPATTTTESRRRR